MANMKVSDLGWSTHDNKIHDSSKRFEMITHVNDHNRFIGVKWTGYRLGKHAIGWEGHDPPKYGSVGSKERGWFCWYDEIDNGEEK